MKEQGVPLFWEITVQCYLHVHAGARNSNGFEKSGDLEHHWEISLNTFAKGKNIVAENNKEDGENFVSYMYIQTTYLVTPSDFFYLFIC